MKAVGCGTWSGVRAGHPLCACFRFIFFHSPLYPTTRGRIQNAPEYRPSYVTTSTDRYGSAYTCTEGSEGHLHRRTRTGVCRRWSWLPDMYRTVSCPFIGSLALEVPILHGLPSNCCNRVGVSILQPCHC